jgi:sulfide:quinone oxidoreductase
VVVIDRKRTFSLGLSNLWVMTGERPHPRIGERDRSALARKGIKYLNERVVAIDPATRRVRTEQRELEGDYLVVALGAELVPQELPGFREAAYNLYEPEGALQIQQALSRFDGGRIVVLVTRLPFKCPAAPYEAALLIEDFLRRRGVRGRSEIALYTPEDQPMPVAGPKVGAKLAAMLRERGIEYFTEQTVLRIDPESRRILFEVEETRYNLLVGVPPHRSPAVVREAGLVDATGWVPVNPETLSTKYEGVYAIGDVVSIRLKNGMFLPKAGVFAEAQARVVATNIAAEIRGEPTTARFNGEGYCYLDVGGGRAAKGYGDFYAAPAPRVVLKPPSEQYRREKEEFERTRLEVWL